MLNAVSLNWCVFIGILAGAGVVFYRQVVLRKGYKLLITVGFMLMFKLCVPFNALRGALFGTMMLAFILGYVLFMDIFSLIPLTASMLFVLIPLLLVLIAFMILSNHFMEHIAEQYANRFFSSKLFQRLHGAGRKRRGA